MDDISARIQVKDRRSWIYRKNVTKNTYLYIDEGLSVGEVSNLLDIPKDIIERIQKERGL